MINGGERSIAGSGDVAPLFVRLMQPGPHYLQPHGGSAASLRASTEKLGASGTRREGQLVSFV